MNREDQLERLKSTPEYDVVIIGGGATGLGCAVDAASRGMKTLLLEKHDFAKGTSSRATKLVHGGVRYLAQGNIRLVREALLERGRLLKNAPHVCRTLAFVVPAYSWWQKYYYGIGLWVYEFLSFKLSLGRTKILSREETLDRLPDVSPDRLTGGVLYFDGQFDDSRLAINLAQTAVEYGATVLNYTAVTGFEKRDGKIVGVHATDELNGVELLIPAKVVVNATGVFGDSILRMADQQSPETIAPSQGVHLVVDSRYFAGETSLMIPKTDDGRVLFVIPWHDKLVVGTTDTPVEEVLVEPRALPEEIDFIVSHFNRYTRSTITAGDLLSVFVGLRPLAKVSDERSTAAMPRDHVIKTLPSGLIHVTGGKWTTYRSMAEHAIDKAASVVDSPACRECQTRQLPIHGSSENRSNGETDVNAFRHLGIYGTDAIPIRAWINEDAGLAERIHPDHPYLRAELRWCIENEMACTVEDLLARRIRLLFLDAGAAMEAAPLAANMLAAHFGHDDHWEQEQITEFIDLAEGYLRKATS